MATSGTAHPLPALFADFQAQSGRGSPFPETHQIVGLGGANCEKVIYVNERIVFALSASERRDEPTLANVANRDVRGLCGRYLDFDYCEKTETVVACARGERVEFITETSDGSERVLGVE